MQYSPVRVQSHFSLLKTILCFSYPKVNYLFPREHKPPGATEKEMGENTLPVLARKKQQGQHCKRSSKACKAFDELRNEDNGVTEM